MKPVSEFLRMPYQVLVPLTFCPLTTLVTSSTSPLLTVPRGDCDVDAVGRTLRVSAPETVTCVHTLLPLPAGGGGGGGGVVTVALFTMSLTRACSASPGQEVSPCSRCVFTWLRSRVMP